MSQLLFIFLQMEYFSVFSKKMIQLVLCFSQMLTYKWPNSSFHRFSRNSFKIDIYQLPTHIRGAFMGDYFNDPFILLQFSNFQSIFCLLL